MGQVESIRQSSDNNRRAATVRYIQNGKVTRVTRPVDKLIPVEYSKEEEERLELTFIYDKDVKSIVYS